MREKPRKGKQRRRSKTNAGYDGLAAAAHSAAESSTGMHVNFCIEEDLGNSADASGYCIYPGGTEKNSVSQFDACQEYHILPGNDELDSDFDSWKQSKNG